jgi:hypothetical protein
MVVLFGVFAAGHAVKAWQERPGMFEVNLLGLVLSVLAYLVRYGDFLPLIIVMSVVAVASLLTNRKVA